MKRALALLFLLLVAGLSSLADAQIVRPAATPRAAGTSRPTATARIPAEAAFYSTGLVLDVDPTQQVYSDDAGTAAQTADAGDVRSFREQSSGQRLFVQNGFPYPTLQVAELNGRDVFDMATSSYFRHSGATDLITGTDEMTMYAVIYASNTNPYLSQDEGGGATDKWFFAHGGFGVTGLHLNGSAGNTTLTGPAASATWRIIVFRRTAAGAYVFRVNGAQTHSGTDATNFSMPNTGPIDVGAAEPGTPFDGFIARVLLYDASLSDANLTGVETYLNTRFAVY